MKTVVLGDTHGTQHWKTIVGFERPDRVIFVGDYFDSFDIKYDAQINNFLDIIEYKETSGVDVVLLLGNHDYHYLPYIHSSSTSGFQKNHAHLIKQIVGNYLHHLQMAYQFEAPSHFREKLGSEWIVVSHAGISVEFMQVNNRLQIDWQPENVASAINDLFKFKPMLFDFNGRDPYGDDTYQTPIWIRPSSLMWANRNSELKKKTIQVFGHTQVEKIDTKGASTGCKYYAIDALQTSGEYMIVDDSTISFNSYKKYKTKKN